MSMLIGFSALEKGAVYLQRVADTVASHMGMVCTILMCGPIAEHDGRIECRGYVFFIFGWHQAHSIM